MLTAEDLIGEEGRGMKYLAHGLARERLTICINCQARAEAVLRDTVAYVADRQVFGKNLSTLQNTRFSLAGVKVELTAGRALVDRMIADHMAGALDEATAAAGKLWITEMLGRCADACLQLHGGWGYMSEYAVSRAYADARVERIAGGRFGNHERNHRSPHVGPPIMNPLANGPLRGLRVLEMPAIGPVPFCGMLLADLGADVLRIDRPESSGLGEQLEHRNDVLGRGKRSLVMDLKAPDSHERVLMLIEKADILIEGFRPGTMERLGLSPEVALSRNPRLVYGRMTGWGQDGPLARAAGHDINFLALTGALHAIGRAGEAPVPPLNLVADFGGGSMFLALGILSAVVERSQSGLGQVIDAAIVDGTSSLTSLVRALMSQGSWVDDRGSNTVDGGAPWYDSYCCQDGKYVCIGSMEPKFFAELVHRLGIPANRFPDHMNPECWLELRALLSECFASRTRAQWCELLEGTDVCFAPVLSLTEAPDHPQMVARHTFVDDGHVTQPAPAPRFSRTPGAIRRSPPQVGEGGADALREWGVPS